MAGLLFVCLQVGAQSTSDCLKYALWREARGEGIITQRAVLDTIQNRVRKSGKGACKVLRKRHQYPYMRYGVKKVLDSKFNKRYNVVFRMHRILPREYVYFNNGAPHSFGKNTVKIGNIYFST